MSTLRIVGHHKGFKKIAHTDYLREHFAMGLRDSKHATDRVLDGGFLEIPVSTASAEAHRVALEALGARVVISESAQPRASG